MTKAPVPAGAFVVPGPRRRGWCRREYL